MIEVVDFGWSEGGQDMLQLHDPKALIPRHIQALTYENVRQGTIGQRRQCLKRLCASLPPGVTLLDVTAEHLNHYLDKPIGPSARSAEISHLRGFYRWAILEELIATDPTVRLRRPRLPRRLPRPMPDEQVTLAFRHAPTHRVKPALYFAAFAGLRAHEIAQLRAEDLRWSDQVIFVADQKGGGQGSVPLSDQLTEGLGTCILPLFNWLFPYMDGQEGHVPGRLISKACNGYLHDIGITHTLHTLRHWFGTKTYRASGRDLRQTQELMRHRSPNSTAIYTYVSPGEATEIVNKLPHINL